MAFEKIDWTPVNTEQFKGDIKAKFDAYLKALGRRIGVEVAVNTSFNVAGPIAQTPQQAIETLRRSRGLDAVLMVSADGPVFAALQGEATKGGGMRFRTWLETWQAETGKRLERQAGSVGRG